MSTDTDLPTYTELDNENRSLRSALARAQNDLEKAVANANLYYKEQGAAYAKYVEAKEQYDEYRKRTQKEIKEVDALKSKLAKADSTIHELRNRIAEYAIPWSGFAHHSGAQVALLKSIQSQLNASHQLIDAALKSRNPVPDNGDGNVITHVRLILRCDDKTSKFSGASREYGTFVVGAPITDDITTRFKAIVEQNIKNETGWMPQYAKRDMINFFLAEEFYREAQVGCATVVVDI